MTPAGAVLREEIRRCGPIPFRRFMEVALYHPEHGYYRRGRDPFGVRGDFYTAEQIQPVFGILIAAVVRRLFDELGGPDGFTVVEPGAGRGEMASAFARYCYVPLEFDCGSMPERFCGVVFANEFFDALPVHLVRRRDHGFREMLVDCAQERFAWVEGQASGELEEFLHRYGAPAEEGDLLEVNLEALRWLERIAVALEHGYVLAIDYGYTAREIIRFPAGSLMSYRRHTAAADVLSEPGLRDLTAHVNFTALQEHGAARGLRTVRLESLAQLLLRAGEEDNFAAALEAAGEEQALRRRLQLKTLLVGMGETFRALLLARQGGQ